MKLSTDTGDRTAALFLFGALVFAAPALAIFGIDVTILGIPALYLYLFTAWATLIALMAWTTRRADDLRLPRATPRPGDDDGG